MGTGRLGVWLWLHAAKGRLMGLKMLSKDKKKKIWKRGKRMWREARGSPDNKLWRIWLSITSLYMSVISLFREHWAWEWDQTWPELYFKMLLSPWNMIRLWCQDERKQWVTRYSSIHGVGPHQTKWSGPDQSLKCLPVTWPWESQSSWFLGGNKVHSWGMIKKKKSLDLTFGYFTVFFHTYCFALLVSALCPSLISPCVLISRPCECHHLSSCLCSVLVFPIFKFFILISVFGLQFSCLHL